MPETVVAPPQEVAPARRQGRRAKPICRPNSLALRGLHRAERSQARRTEPTVRTAARRARDGRGAASGGRAAGSPWRGDSRQETGWLEPVWPRAAGGGPAGRSGSFLRSRPPTRSVAVGSPPQRVGPRGRSPAPSNSGPELAELSQSENETDLPRSTAAVILRAHRILLRKQRAERWDGSGPPQASSGGADAIPCGRAT